MVRHPLSSSQNRALISLTFSALLWIQRFVVWFYYVPVMRHSCAHVFACVSFGEIAAVVRECARACVSQKYPEGGLPPDAWEGLFNLQPFQARLAQLINLLELVHDDMSVVSPHWKPLGCAAAGPALPDDAGASALPSKVFIACERKYLTLACRVAADLASAGHKVLFNPDLVAAGDPRSVEFMAYVDSMTNEAMVAVR